MATTTDNKASNYREDYPGYCGFIPYKFSIIGKGVGATNETIKAMLTDDPPTEKKIKPGTSQDYSHYNRDYWCDDFDRSFPLEEEKIFSNRSKEANTWICGSKYKIYPQHIPKTEVYVPGITSANLYGKGYSRTTAISVKDEYNKGQDCDSKERYKTSSQMVYIKPQTRSEKEELNLALKTEPSFFMSRNGRAKTINKSVDDKFKIYHSKIAKVPTVGYTGNQYLFQDQIGYLNYKKILEKEKAIKAGRGKASYANLPPKFQEALNIMVPDEEPPFVMGYRGYKPGVKAQNLFGLTTSLLALQARNANKQKDALV